VDTDPAQPSLDLSGVDLATSKWWQGDCVVGELWFAFRVDSALAVTQQAKQAIDQGLDLVDAEVEGLVVLSQTCDIVRPCTDRPFVEVCPLVKIPADQMASIAKGRRPAYAQVPSLVSQGLVADLDRVMTVEKPVMARWTRVAGCSTDEQRRRFAWSLARKRGRFAFPDDFEAIVGDLKERLDDKHDKNSPEGRALRALREIRVAADPSWNADSVSLMFWFIRDQDSVTPDSVAWDDYLNRWLGLIKTGGRFVDITGVVTLLDGMTAVDYVSSDPLDLDRLSSSSTN
jgi:hypothetical protein